MGEIIRKAQFIPPLWLCYPTSAGNDHRAETKNAPEGTYLLDDWRSGLRINTNVNLYLLQMHSEKKDLPEPVVPEKKKK